MATQFNSIKRWFRSPVPAVGRQLDLESAQLAIDGGSPDLLVRTVRQEQDRVAPTRESWPAMPITIINPDPSTVHLTAIRPDAGGAHAIRSRLRQPSRIRPLNLQQLVG